MVDAEKCAAFRDSTSVLDGINAIHIADQNAVRGDLFVEGHVQVCQHVCTKTEGETNAGVCCCAGGTANESFFGWCHASLVCNRGDYSSAAPTFYARYNHAVTNFCAEELFELLRRPRGGRIGLWREKVSAELAFGPHPGRSDDMNSCGLGQGFIEFHIATVVHPGGINEGIAPMILEVLEFFGQDVENLCAVNCDLWSILGPWIDR